MKSFTSTLSSVLVVATLALFAQAAPVPGDTVCLPLAFPDDNTRLAAQLALDVVVCEPLAAGTPERQKCDLFAQDKMTPSTFRACGTVSGAAPATGAAADEVCIPVTFHTAENLAATLALLKTEICDHLPAGADKDNCTRFVDGSVKGDSIVACGVPKAQASP